MQTVADLLGDLADSDAPAVVGADRNGVYEAAEVAAHAWQVGNLLAQYGVHEGASVSLVSGPASPGPDDEPGDLGRSPLPILVALGAMADGAVVDPSPPGAAQGAVLVVPTAWLEEYAPGPGTKPIAYGEAPDDPAAAHLDAEAWSENPMAPPVDLDPTTSALSDRSQYSHGDLLAASRRVVADNDIAAGDVVDLRAPLSSVGTVVAGVLAPLRVGARVAPGPVDDPDYVAGTGGDPAIGRIDPAAATPR